METLQLSREETIHYIIDLENEGKLTLKNQEIEAPERFLDYIRTHHATWFWITLILTVASTLMIMTITEGSYLLLYARYFLGIITVLFLPGYCLIKILYPGREIDKIERVGLSIGTSIAMVPMIGLLLNYTPYGIRLTPLTLSLLTLTILLAITGIFREHQEKKNIT
jgi:uncharacterized membrane protein